MGHREAGQVLQQILDEEGRTDKLLTQIAESERQHPGRRHGHGGHGRAPAARAPRSRSRSSKSNVRLSSAHARKAPNEISGGSELACAGGLPEPAIVMVVDGVSEDKGQERVMEQTVVALYDNLDTAQAAVKELLDNGFSRDDISVVRTNQQGDYTSGNMADDPNANAGDASGIAAGAGIGAVLGGLAGLLVGPGCAGDPRHRSRHCSRSDRHDARRRRAGRSDRRPGRARSPTWASPNLKRATTRRACAAAARW